METEEVFPKKKTISSGLKTILLMQPVYTGQNLGIKLQKALLAYRETPGSEQKPQTQMHLTLFSLGQGTCGGYSVVLSHLS